MAVEKIAADKREAILTAATETFARLGFKKASIDEIARRANVGKGTVYLVAESKEDLYYQVLHREVRAWQAECGHAIDPRKKADELLVELLAISMAYVAQRPLVKELLFGRTLELMPTWAERLRDLRAIGNQNLVELLHLGIRQKVFRKDLNVPVVSNLLADWNVAGYLLESVSAAPVDPMERALIGLDVVLNGLRVR